MERFSLHSHTTYSDGELSPRELIENSILYGYGLIGITDHAFTSKVDSVDNRNFDRYLNTLQRLQEEFKRIKVKIGLEIDMNMFTGVRTYRLPFNLINNLDYVLLEGVSGLEENHYSQNLYDIAKICNKIKIPVGLAHHFYFDPPKERIEEFAKVLGENDIFLR